MLASPGTTRALDFVSAADIASGRHGSAPNVVQEAFGPDGQCLRINIPKTSSSDPGATRFSLGATFGVGQEFYVAFQIFMGPGYLTPSNGGGGKKQIIISQYNASSPNSSQSDTEIEIVMNQLYGSSLIGAYHEPDHTGFWVPKGSDFIMQTGNPTCLYSNMDAASTPCMKFIEGQWMTFLQRIKVGKFNGSTGNEHDLWVAYQGDTAWRQVGADRAFALGADGPGYTGFWLLPYDTGRSSGNVDTFVRYARAAVSTQPIALASMR